MLLRLTASEFEVVGQRGRQMERYDQQGLEFKGRSEWSGERNSEQT